MTEGGTCGSCASCACIHHKSLPVLTVLFGLLFLSGTYGLLAPEWVNIGWPVIVILAGLSKLSSGMCKCCAPRA